MSDQAGLRIVKEVKQIKQGSDLSLAVSVDDSNIRSIHAIILGPPDTPYQFGFFEFSIKFGKDYPAKPPNVRCLTTNRQKCRFNPNIYASGKVCLSILGTWSGSRGEQWSSAQGLESVLISIQSLMSNDPYENEPGFEGSKSPKDVANKQAYVDKIRHETLRIAVIQPLESVLGILPDGTMKPSASTNSDMTPETDDIPIDDDQGFDQLADFRKRRFLWYFDSYLQTIDTAMEAAQAKSQFTRMPFESTGNTMDGHFNYPDLKRRLNIIHRQVLAETHRWSNEGLLSTQQETGISASLKTKFDQSVTEMKQHNNFTVDLSLVDNNPFEWELTYFGRPMTQLDGGIFKIRIHFSPRFPDDQPRVFVKTPIFHIRVSKQEGALCYFPRRAEDIHSHIEAIVAALEEEKPAYDPRASVNPEAMKLFWGSSDDKKKYNRQLRRSVEKSVEDAFA